MNVNPESPQFGEVKPLSELTEAEKASGDWIELPDVSGEPPRARKATELERAFADVPKREFDEVRETRREQQQIQRELERRGGRR